MKLSFDPERMAGAHVLLFYKPHEVDRFLPGDRYLKRLVRPIWERTHHRQKISGVGMSFRLLRQGLEAAGYVVHCNDYAAARANPDYPVGLVGAVDILAGWRLPNPALLGPSLFDQPGHAPRLFDDQRFRGYVCLGEWMFDMFEQVYPGRCVRWFAGLDAEAWPDRSDEPKDLDFLVYDKVLWDRERQADALTRPILDELEARHQAFELIRYGNYDHEVYRSLLGRARALLFLCDHETQGIAYQEAMASGLPVLAWDPGFWADPQWRKCYDAPPPASSTPFFSEACGERFKALRDFPAALDRFSDRLNTYRPRQYVLDNLGLRRSGELYAAAYFGIRSDARAQPSRARAAFA